MSNLTSTKAILDHLHDCKKDNQERLKGVKTLEDLVKFKVATVVDKLREGSTGHELKGIEIF